VSNLYLKTIPPKPLVIRRGVPPTRESILVVGSNGLGDGSCDISITKPAIEHCPQIKGKRMTARAYALWKLLTLTTCRC